MLDFARDGAALSGRTISAADIKALRQEFATLDFRVGARPFALSSLVQQLLGPAGCFGKALKEVGLEGARPVRIFAFDKTPANNWNLGWHQDRVIAVKERRDIAGFGNWTAKNGILHVEAPEGLLKHMVFLRLHLDGTPRSNGALKIIAGSADHGKLTDAQVRQYAAAGTARICEAREGEILAVKALTLHASEPAKEPRHRRVLHVDYCGAPLPAGLEWALEP